MTIYILMVDDSGTTFSRAYPCGVTFDKEVADKWKLKKQGYGYGEVVKIELDKAQIELLKKELMKK